MVGDRGVATATRSAMSASVQLMLHRD